MIATLIEMVASASDGDLTELKELIEAALVVNAGKGQLYVMWGLLGGYKRLTMRRQSCRYKYQGDQHDY